MKLAFLWRHFIERGGVERILSQKLNLLAEQDGFEIYLITYNQGSNELSFPLSPKVHHVDLGTRYAAYCSYKGFYQYIDRYNSKRAFFKTVIFYLRQLDPDIITTVDFIDYEIEAVLRAKLRGKVFVESHTGKKLVELREQLYKPLGRLRFKWMLRSLFHYVSKVDKVICLTEEDEAEWKKIAKNTLVIPNMLAEYPLVDKDYTNIHNRIISVGRIDFQKGFDILLNAWHIVIESHPDWELDIYGDVPFNRVNDLAQRQIKGVTFHSSTSDIYSKYKESDIYVMSSRYESFGLVIIEAMSCGLPIISFDCPHGPRNLIADGMNGLLCKNGDYNDLTKKICYLIEHAEERERMGNNARRRAKDFLPEDIIGKWIELYKS